jgi:DNA-binding XRE family transcriptional regulator
MLGAYAMIMGILYEIQGQVLRPSLDDRSRSRLTLAMNSLRGWLDRRNRKISRTLSAAHAPGKRYRMRFLGVALDWPKGGPKLPHDRGTGYTFSSMVCAHWPVSPSHLARQALSPRVAQAPVFQQALTAQTEIAPPIQAGLPVQKEQHGPRSLRELREERGLTQVALARAAGLTQAMLSRTETRDDHLLSTLRKYATALGATLEVALVFPGGRRVMLRQALSFSSAASGAMK